MGNVSHRLWAGTRGTSLDTISQAGSSRKTKQPHSMSRRNLPSCSARSEMPRSTCGSIAKLAASYLSKKEPGIVAQKQRFLCPRKPFRYNERVFSKFGRKLFQQKGIRMKPQNDQHADVRSCIERHFLRFANSTDKAPLYILSLFVDRKIRRPSVQVDQVVVFEGLQIKVGVRHV